MTTPGFTPEQGLPAGAQGPGADGARDPAPEELRAKVAALADQVRALANGSRLPLAAAPAIAAGKPSATARSDRADTDDGVEDERSVASARGAREEPPHTDGRGTVSSEPPAAPPAPPPAAAGAEEYTDLSGRLLAAVIDTAELAAAEIRAGAEREAAEIRERADAAIGEADAALARYREALAALDVETERIERSIAALREQAQALEAERGRVDAALELLHRRRAASAGGA